MNGEIFIKYCSDNTVKELENIGFSKEYLYFAKDKFNVLKLKVFNLSAAEANIFKQTCLSIGFDAAVNRYAVNCKCESSDAVFTTTLEDLKILIQKLSKQPFRLKELSEKLEKIIGKPKNYKIRNKIFDKNKTYLMGILNVTPDSFSDGGKYFEIENAVRKGFSLIEDGADIIDIGGESTNPNAELISVEEEIKRVIPVITKIREKNKEVIISVDTRHSETIKQAIYAGADILNTVVDIRNFEDVFDILSEHNIPVVITHSAEIPPKPVEKDFDGDIVDEIYKYFVKTEDYLKSTVLKNNLLIFDTGIGFGKSINDQFELIKRADEFSSLNYPVMYGISRKSFLSKTFGMENRDKATEMFSEYLMLKGVNILRVHDVKTHFEMKNYLSKIM